MRYSRVAEKHRACGYDEKLFKLNPGESIKQLAVA
jgi:hypothetical protein